MTANSSGSCPYNVFAPFGIPFGNGSFTGIVQDVFGTNMRAAPFTISDFSDDNIEPDTSVSFWDADDSNENRLDNGNENEPDNDE